MTFDPVAATAEYLARVPADARARSDAYFEGSCWLQLADSALWLAIVWLMLSRGVSANLRARAERWSRRPSLQTFYYWVQFLILTTLVRAPFTIYEGYFREHQYGLSNMSLGAYLGDEAKGLAIGVVLGGVLLVALFAIVRRLARSWWIWGTVVTLVFSAAVQLIAPVYLAPLFNDYKPVTDAAIREPILSLARGNGVPVDQVYEFDASRQSKRVSANVSGLGHTMRVSLNDNLLKRCNKQQILSVLGHEIGHYVLHHVVKGMIFSTLMILAGFAWLRGAVAWALARRGVEWGVRGVDDPAVLPLAFGAVLIFFTVLQPIGMAFSRQDEAEADLFGLNAVGDADAQAEVELMLLEYRKADPGPIEELLFYDHPSPRKRILMAMTWKAEHLLK